MAIEMCPHCNSTVLFTDDVCPSCRQNRTATVTADTKRKDVTSNRERFLSNKLTLYYKMTIPVILLVYIIVLLSGVASGSIKTEMFVNTYDGFKALVLLIVFIVSYVFLFSKIKRVKYDDSNLYYAAISNFVKVPLANIDAINKMPWILNSDLFSISAKNVVGSDIKIIFIRKKDGAIKNPSTAIGALLKKLDHASINI